MSMAGGSNYTETGQSSVGGGFRPTSSPVTPMFPTPIAGNQRNLHVSRNLNLPTPNTSFSHTSFAPTLSENLALPSMNPHFSHTYSSAINSTILAFISSSKPFSSLSAFSRPFTPAHVSSSTSPLTFGTNIPISATETQPSNVAQMQVFSNTTQTPYYRPQDPASQIPLYTSNQPHLVTSQIHVAINQLPTYSDMALPILFILPENSPHNLRHLKATILFPEFDETNVRGCICRCKYYFDYYRVTEEDKMICVAITVKDNLDSWFDSHVIDHGGGLIGDNLLRFM